MSPVSPEIDTRSASNMQAAKISLFYTFVAGAWLFVSDSAVEILAQDSHEFTVYQNWNGWFFVAITALILFTLVRSVLSAVRISELKAHASEARYRSLFEANPQPMWVYDLDSLRFLAVNDAAVAHYGYSQAEFLAMSLADLRSEEGVPPLLANVAAATAGIDRTGVWRHRRKDGGLIDVEIVSHRLDFAGHRAEMVLAQDVTAQRQMQVQLAESEARLRLAAAAANQGLLDFDIAAGTVRTNAQYALMLGREPAEFVESFDVWLQRLHPDDRDEALQTFRDYMEGRVPEYRSEFRVRHKAGHWIWILSIGKVTERDAQGNPRRMLGSHTDISADKAAEWRIRRLADLYAALSETNQAIVRATDRDRLFQSICRIAVDHGAMKAAWIGMVSPDGGRIVPIASHGAGLEGLERSEIATTPSGPTACVPASCAFHTGQRFLSNDLANDIKVGPWRQVASVRGLGAATALPLRCEGRVVGSFTVYAAEAGFFDDELLELLDEMAVDISFALDNFVREAASATAAEALRASEERYRELLQSLNDVVWSYTLESRTLYLNDAASAVYGRARQDLIENPALWLAAVHPEDAAAVRSASGRLLSTGRAEGEYRIVRPDGEIRWLHDRATVIRNGAGETIRFAGVATDVTSRKLAEQALRDGRALLRTIIDTVPLWLSYLDRDGRYIVANRRHSETFDKSTSDIEGAHFRNVLPAALYERQRLLFDECLQGKVVRFTEQLLLAGQQIHAQGVLVPRMDEQDGVQGVVVAVTDITELRRSEERLLASEARLNEAQHLAHIGSWELDIPNNHLDWSDETYQIFETDRHLFRGTLDAFLDLVHTDDRDLVRKAYTESIDKGTPYELVHRLRTRDGRIKYVLERCRTIYGADGTPLRSLGSVQDITAVKQAEQQIRALNEQLERRVQERTAELENTNRELESFSYSVSHDLRAPLRAIDGFSAIIEREHASGLDEDARHMLSRVRLAVQRMGRLIDDLLGLSRLSRSALNRAPTNLSAVAAEIVTELREGAANSQVAVKVQPGLVADADPNLIRIALANLLGNAWKFSSKRAAPRIEFGATKIEGRNGTCYFVRDNGAGFDMRYAGKLFGPFQRLHGETEFAGTGIGLATVQRIIHRHGGRVWAEAAVNAGATFYFTLGA